MITGLPVTAALLLGPGCYERPGPFIFGDSRWLANARQHYIPGIIAHDSQGVARISALPAQDSAKLTGLIGADALIVRPPDAAPALDGEVVQILPFDP